MGLRRLWFTILMLPRSLASSHGNLSQDAYQKFLSARRGAQQSFPRAAPDKKALLGVSRALPRCFPRAASVFPARTKL